MTEKQITVFQGVVSNFYRQHKRSFPWRKTRDPYRILVSEIMLQQTRAERVIPKFETFMQAFPTVKALAQAPLRRVLKNWQGLGYNRRGLMLHKAARIIHQEYGGEIPHHVKALQELPGIGPYTAAAIAAFAYNKPAIVIETNIRTVFIHHFFKGKKNVHDKEILPLIEQTLDTKHPKIWYSALMDYGAYLKKKNPNPSRRSKHYSVQSRFIGSDRQIRGAIIRELTKKNHTKKSLILPLRTFSGDTIRIENILQKLKHDGLVKESKNILRLG